MEQKDLQSRVRKLEGRLARPEKNAAFAIVIAFTGVPLGKHGAFGPAAVITCFAIVGAGLFIFFIVALIRGVARGKARRESLTKGP